MVWICFDNLPKSDLRPIKVSLLIIEKPKLKETPRVVWRKLIGLLRASNRFVGPSLLVIDLREKEMRFGIICFEIRRAGKEFDCFFLRVFRDSTGILASCAKNGRLCRGEICLREIKKNDGVLRRKLPRFFIMFNRKTFRTGYRQNCRLIHLRENIPVANLIWIDVFRPLPILDCRGKRRPKARIKL